MDCWGLGGFPFIYYYDDENPSAPPVANSLLDQGGLELLDQAGNILLDQG